MSRRDPHHHPATRSLETAPALETGDLTRPREDRVLPVVVVLDHLRSAFNVGNIFRLADAVRLRQVITCGYTASPPHPKLAKTARGTDACVPCRYCASAHDAVADLHRQGCTVYAIDTAPDARAPWDVPLQFPAAFVFGNEALGIEAAVLERCDVVLALPRRGFKNSINVGNCAAVVLFEALRQWSRTCPAPGDGSGIGVEDQ